VDVAEAAGAVARLIDDPSLRRRMGEAGRRRALEHFAWARIIRAYEDLWARQDAERSARARSASRRWTGPDGPAWYPAPERSFAGYPSSWLDRDAWVQVAPGAEEALGPLLSMLLTHHAEEFRAGDRTIYSVVLAAAAHPHTIHDLDRVFRDSGVPPGIARATLAWMLKYDLLREVTFGTGRD
jgi:hypothetical protein